MNDKEERMLKALPSMQLPNIGIDGCKRGWVGVFRNENSSELQGLLIDKIGQLNCSNFGCIAIDIPIGLPESGSRTCDKEARSLLVQRGCCVFSAPIRPLLDALTYGEACNRRYSIEGKKISLQTWHIIPKIREVDEFLRDNQHNSQKIYEVHPEISFLKMNKGCLLATKSRSAGKLERATLVDSYFGEGSFLRLKSSLLPRNGWGDDDLLDACAALWTAERIARGAMDMLPTSPQFDPHGLPMRILY